MPSWLFFRKLAGQRLGLDCRRGRAAEPLGRITAGGSDTGTRVRVNSNHPKRWQLSDEVKRGHLHRTKRESAAAGTWIFPEGPSKQGSRIFSAAFAETPGNEGSWPVIEHQEGPCRDRGSVQAGLIHPAPPSPTTPAFVPTPNHSHVVDNSRVNTGPIGWEVRPVLVLEQPNWPGS